MIIFRLEDCFYLTIRSRKPSVYL